MRNQDTDMFPEIFLSEHLLIDFDQLDGAHLGAFGFAVDNNDYFVDEGIVLHVVLAQVANICQSLFVIYVWHFNQFDKEIVGHGIIDDYLLPVRIG